MYDNTKSLKRLVDYICQQPISQWGFSASFTINDDTHIDEITDQIKLAILRLKENKFDIRRKFRFYNEVIEYPGKTCQAGVSIFALGTNLEVWPCQSMIDKKPLGYFDENLKNLLETAEGNKYFYNRILLPQCTDCGVLNWCRGGCRAVHLSDMKAVELTCKIKQEIINFILRETERYNYYQRNSICNHQSDDNLDDIIKEYLTNMPNTKIEPMFVETAPLSDD